MSKRKETSPPAVARQDRFRDRIREFRSVRAGDIIPHPLNPRTHTAAQLAAVTGLLVDVGKIRTLTAFPADGLGPAGDFSRLMFADGHGRQAIDPNETWRVAVTDLTYAEATEALFADRTGELAGYDAVKLDAAMREFNTGCAELQQMLDDLWEDSKPPDEPGNAGDDTTYTNKIIAPVYEPKGERPPLAALIDRDKTRGLIADIDAAELPDDVKEFLRLAAERHTVFNFRQIAEYYCHAGATLQDLMERSGLVIIDFHKAIEYGFVHLTERLGQLADLEEADGDA